MDYRTYIAKKLPDCGVPAEEIAAAVTVPPDRSMGDYALPCFKFAKAMRKSPVKIAEDLAAGRLVAPFPGVTLPTRGYHAYLPEARAGDRAATAFREWLEEVGRLDGWDARDGGAR